MTTYGTDLAQTMRPVISNLPQNDQYTYCFSDWLVMYDTFKGEREVKAQGVTYLPKTFGMSMEGGLGEQHYTSYKTRAVFFEYVAETVLGMYGLLWQKEPQIRLPEPLEAWKADCTLEGDSLMEFYRKLTLGQIWKGRFCYLVDVAWSRPMGQMYPWLVPYHPEAVVHWGETLDKDGKKVLSFVLLDESVEECDPDTLAYEQKVRWRLCGLHLKDISGEWLPEPVYYTVSGEIDKNGDTPNFRYDYGDDRVVYPMYKGKTLPYIPFVFANVTDTRSDVQKPPLLGLANIALAIYRDDADYREALHKQASSTLFIKGMTPSEAVLTGSSAALITAATQADAKFIEPSGNGLAEMRQSEDNLKKTAVEMGISLLQKSSGDETGASVKQHITVLTATLKTISKTAADAMKKGLDIVCDWVGLPEATIMPPTDFSLSNENADSLLKVWQVMEAGGSTPRDYYEWLRQNDYTSAAYDEWFMEFSAARARKELEKERELEAKTKPPVADDSVDGDAGDAAEDGISDKSSKNDKNNE